MRGSLVVPVAPSASLGEQLYFWWVTLLVEKVSMKRLLGIVRGHFLRRTVHQKRSFSWQKMVAFYIPMSPNPDHCVQQLVVLYGEIAT